MTPDRALAFIVTQSVEVGVTIDISYKAISREQATFSNKAGVKRSKRTTRMLGLPHKRIAPPWALPQPPLEQSLLTFGSLFFKFDCLASRYFSGSCHVNPRHS